MKKSSILLRLLLCLLILGGLIALGYYTNLLKFDLQQLDFKPENLYKIALMAFCVLTVETLLVLILSLPNPKNHRARSILSVLSSLMKYLAAIVILCWALSILGVNVQMIVASVGVVALIVGFSAESLIADVVTGAFMIFENQYNVGDIVEVDGFRGTVTSIGIRTTCIKDAVDNVKIVNNSSMKNLLNRSDNLSYSIIDISVPYETDLEALEKHFPALVQEMFAQNSDIFRTAPEYYGVQALADSSVVLRFGVQVDECNIYVGARRLNRAVWLGLRKVGVECPFPQIDVHQK